MALKRITEEEMNAQGVIAAPDILNGTPSENKAIFDRLVRNVVAAAFNSLVKELEGLGVEQIVRLGDEAGFVYVRLNADKALETSEDGVVWEATNTDGKSAYQIAVENGYSGTETDFNEAMVAMPNHIASTDNPHGVTAVQVGAAPTGYGLGEPAKLLTSEDDMDTIFRGGNYYYRSSSTPKNAPNLQALVADVCLVEVIGTATNVWKQVITPVKNGTSNTAANNSKLVRSNYGVIKGWDWINPQMILDIEYRTTERYMGKPVYAKLCDFGAMPNNATETKEGILPRHVNCVSIQGYQVASSGKSGPFETSAYRNGIDMQTNTSGNVTITTPADLSSYTAYILIKYTKE